MRATVKPLSPKAKNRFANLLKGNPTVIIEQEVDGKFFFVSPDGRYCAWTPAFGPDWELTLNNQNDD